MFWATNNKSLLMLGVDAALAHKIPVTPKTKGTATCSLFKEKGDLPECEPADERPIVREQSQIIGCYSYNA